MKSLVIEGMQPLNGEISVSGNKNAILPIIAASILTDKKVIIHNVPRIIDVFSMLEIFEYLGGAVKFEGSILELEARDIKYYDIPEHLCEKLRASILFIAPLLYRTNKVKLTPPGGDVIGRRRLDTHFYGLIQLGVSLDIQEKYFYLEHNGLEGKYLLLDEPSVTATEQILMASVYSKGKTTLYNVACEPHVQDLCVFLNKIGAKIFGIGTNSLVVEGVECFTGIEHTIGHDYIEAGSYLALVAACGGCLKVNNVSPEPYLMIKSVFERLGVHLEISSESIYLSSEQERKIKPDFDGSISTISDGPWPQFPSDLMSMIILLSTQCYGSVMFFEKMFEGRLFFTDYLCSMGANIILCDPHRIVVQGAAPLIGTKLNSPDIRAGMALLGAALIAKGNSVVHNIKMIERGYSGFVENLESLGAKISVNDF